MIWLAKIQNWAVRWLDSWVWLNVMIVQKSPPYFELEGVYKLLKLHNAMEESNSSQHTKQTYTIIISHWNIFLSKKERREKLIVHVGLASKASMGIFLFFFRVCWWLVFIRLYSLADRIEFDILSYRLSWTSVYMWGYEATPTYGNLILWSL